MNLPLLPWYSPQGGGDILIPRHINLSVSADIIFIYNWPVVYVQTFAPIGPTGPTAPGWPLDPLSPGGPCQSNTRLRLRFYQTTLWLIIMSYAFRISYYRDFFFCQLWKTSITRSPGVPLTEAPTAPLGPGNPMSPWHHLETVNEAEDW